ncbi:hypothetical protein FB639_005066, partial [Coemansia asiatica]
MLAQGPPIINSGGGSQTSQQHMLESVCRSGDSAAAGTDRAAAKIAAATDGLDEEKLWRLYTKSENVLPNGSRARNLLWRMQSRRLKNPSVNAKQHEDLKSWAGTNAAANTVLHGPLTESPKTAAVSEFTGNSGHIAALSMPAPRQLPKRQQPSSSMAADAATEMTLLDFRRRSSSHAVAGTDRASDGSALLGLGPATTLQPQHHYMTLPLPRQQQQQSYQPLQHIEQPYAPVPTMATTAATGGMLDLNLNLDMDLDLDLELARPLELWQMPLDASLFLLPPTAASTDAGRDNSSTLASLFPAGNSQLGLGMPFASAQAQYPNQQQHPNQQQPLLHTEVICDTKFIDARSSAIAHARKCAAGASSSDSSAAPAMTEEQMRTALDSVLRSPTSLLPHWPEQVKDPAAQTGGAPVQQKREDAISDANQKHSDK